MLDKVLRIDALMEISNFLTEKRYDINGLSVNMKVDKDTLKKIGEDYQYRYNTNDKIEFDDNIKEINFNIGGIIFKYYSE